MPLWLRRVLWGVAALLIVLVAAALWLVTTFDANRYKGVAIDWVKTHRNRTLTIDGPIELSVFPRLRAGSRSSLFRGSQSRIWKSRTPGILTRKN